MLYYSIIQQPFTLFNFPSLCKTKTNSNLIAGMKDVKTMSNYLCNKFYFIF